MTSVPKIEVFTIGETSEPPEAPARREVSRKKMVLIGVIAAIVLGGGLYAKYWWEAGRFIQSTDDAYVGGDVTVIAPRISGVVAEIDVTDNQTVKTGQLLLKIDDRDFRAALAKAEAAVTLQDATILNLDATRTRQGAIIAAAKSDVDAAMAEATRSDADVDRYRQLADAQASSIQRFQQADADHKRAEANLDKASATLDAAQGELAILAAERKQAVATRDQAIADRDMAKLNLSYTEVRAPVAGVVGNRSARLGSYAQAGANLLSLVPDSGLWVDANFKESQLGTMHPGQAATVISDILPEETFTGHVESIAPATGAQFSILPAENATGNFTKIVQRVPVRIRLDGDGGTLGKLRPGLSVTATVDRRIDGQDTTVLSALGLRKSKGHVQ